MYYARSPIHFAERIACPVILFQGLEDKVVPPSQAEMMVEALRAKDLPVAYLAFEGEQHGFRKAETIRRTLEAELYFYSRIFRFPLTEAVEAVEIENLPSRGPARAPYFGDEQLLCEAAATSVPVSGLAVFAAGTQRSSAAAPARGYD